MKNTGRMARRKGHAFEREISIALRVVFSEARRHLEFQKEEAYGVDILNTGQYRIQCKRGRKWASLSAIKEVQADEEMGEVPVLITKGDHERTLVALPLEEFLRLLQR